jgi:hypothetical protein
LAAKQDAKHDQTELHFTLENTAVDFNDEDDIDCINSTTTAATIDEHKFTYSRF